MGNVNRAFSATVAGLAATGGIFPLNQPIDVAVRMTGIFGEPPASTIKVACYTPGVPEPLVNTTSVFVNTSVAAGGQISLTIPPQATPRLLLCAINSVSSDPDLWTLDEVSYGVSATDFQVALQFGPDSGGSRASYIANGDEVLNTGKFLNLPVSRDVATGVRVDAIYRCASQATVSNPIGLMNLTHPTGVFASSFARATSTSPSASYDTPQFAFTHNATQLCGAASRQYTINDGQTTIVYETYSACSAQYPSTAGKWVVGSMTFNATDATFQFYLDGQLLPTEAQSPATAATVRPSATMIESGNIFLLSAQNQAATESVSIKQGTLIDRVSIYSLAADTAVDIRANWNRPINTTSPHIVENLVYSAAMHPIRSTQAASFAVLVRSESNSLFFPNVLEVLPPSNGVGNVLPLRWTSQFTEPRSCTKAACAEVNEVGVDYVAADVSSTGSAGGSTGAEGSSGVCETCMGSIVVPSILVGLLVQLASTLLPSQL